VAGELSTLAVPVPGTGAAEQAAHAGALRAGYQADALRVFERTRRALSELSGGQPGRELQRIFVAILRQDDEVLVREENCHMDDDYPRLGELTGTGHLAWTVLPIGDGRPKVVAHRSFRQSGRCVRSSTPVRQRKVLRGAVRLRFRGGGAHLRLAGERHAGRGGTRDQAGVDQLPA